MGLFSRAQSVKADAILGSWLNEEKDGRIEIYRSQNKYFGKLVWVNRTEPDGSPKKDELNQDEKLRNRVLLNTIILTDVVYNNGVWENGKIYDPKSGKTYNCTIKLRDGKLELRGYVGTPMFGRTTVWERG